MDHNIDDNQSSSSDIQSSETQVIDVEDDETITMLDVLQEEQDLEDNAFAVLAGSDDQNCTYLKGYVSRQALYSCNTCQMVSAEDDKRSSAAICLACSYRCHDGHDLIELYTKRNFRCDCGNHSFVDNKCKLYSKSGLNDKNQYNQNFDGLYCVCLRPYPDPDSDVDDSMVQCVVCEDWFHGRHLEEFPENEDFAEMICKSCMNRLPFLWFYHKSGDEKVVIEKAETDAKIDVTSVETKPQPQEPIEGEPSLVCESDSGVETSCDSLDSSPNVCKLQVLKSKTSEQTPEQLVPTYWPLGWRQNLCKCKTCLQTYNEKKCLFLTDEKDMVHYYETQSSQSNTRVSHYDKGLSELNKMNRIQQIEYINGYNDLKNSLEEYLRKFAENKKTVREEDIKEFFAQMASRKRQKVDIPYNCK